MLIQKSKYFADKGETSLKVIFNLFDFAARRKAKFFSTIFATCILVIIIALMTVFLLLDAQKEYENKISRLHETETLTLEIKYAFKLQVQEWKNILLRGNQKDAFDKYYNSFINQYKQTQFKTDQLVELLSKDSNSITFASDFKQQHILTLKGYESALEIFVKSGYDEQLADKEVRGIDRKPDQLLTELSKQLALESERLNILLDKELLEFKFVLGFIFFTIQGVLCLVLVRLTGRMLSLSLTHKPTGMGNRNYFIESIKDCISNNIDSTIAIIDIDEFKIINETCGNSGGDRYLKFVSEKINKALGRDGKVFSIGADLIGVVIHLPHTVSLQRLKDASNRIANFNFLWEEIQVSLTCSTASYHLKTNKTNSVENVLNALYVALQVSKQNPSNKLLDYNKKDDGIAWVQKQLRMVHKIPSILENKQAVLFRQAITPINDQTKDTYYEILLRLIDKKGAISSPGLFLQSAQRFKLITRVDKYVIKQLLSYLENQPTDAFNYSINLSGQTLSDSSFVSFLNETLGNTKLDTTRLSFEITESDIINRIENAIDIINCLSQYGCKVVLDDFGAGMSSYAYISDMKVSTIKIDGQFVTDLPNKPQNKAIIKSIVALANEMQIETVGEFVETKQELDCLAELSVDFAQGYHLDRPSLLCKPK